MSFNDIACHVWAIDGYVNDEVAGDVNNRYSLHANSLFNSVENTMAWRIRALQSLITHSRRSAETSESAIAYGGFRDGQAAPEHMWLEYKGTIYETMPGSDLIIYPATPALRQQPKLEGYTFPDNGVASVLTKLTVNQQNYLNSRASYGTSGPVR